MFTYYFVMGCHLLEVVDIHDYVQLFSMPFSLLIAMTIRELCCST